MGCIPGRILREALRTATLIMSAGLISAGLALSPFAQKAAASDLPFDLLRALAKKDPGKNVVVSPLSIGAALALLSDGASGDTQQEIRALVGQDTQAALQRFREAGRSEKKSAETLVEFGSCLWSTPQIHFLETFSQAAQRDYSAITIVSDPQAAPALINDWMSRTTHGLIRTAVDAPPDARGIVLANGMVFLGKWSDPFDPALTRPGTFNVADGQARTVPMMMRGGKFRYAAVPDGQLIDLPYDDGRYSFRIFLPSESSGLAGWLAAAGTQSWKTLGDGLQQATGELVMPRLDLSFAAELTPLLETLGIKSAFRSGAADFSAMTVEKASLFVSSVFHRAVVKVDESGTKAAASTVIQMPGSVAPRQPFRMIVDRPFLFAIHEVSHGDLLFLGMVGSF